MKTVFVIRLSTLAVAVVTLALTTGCTTVQPWDRGNLADYTMQADRDVLQATMVEHIYFSREASTGGRGVGGGGCGCN
jgi:hypothetical protein